MEVTIDMIDKGRDGIKIPYRRIAKKSLSEITARQ